MRLRPPSYIGHSQRLWRPDPLPGPRLNPQAVLGLAEGDFRRQVQDDTGVKPPWAAEAFSDLDEDVKQSIARIKASPFVPRKDSLRGFVYDVHDGSLREVS
jgi:carbonic anhydrase